MMRLTTFLAGTVFLAVAGSALFLLAGTANLPSIWAYLAIREAFTIASVLVMSEAVARERMKPGANAKPEPLYNAGATIAWLAHVVLAALDLGRFHWSAGFPIWLQVLGAVGMAGGLGLVVWALRHNDYLSARIRIQSDRGQRVATTGPYAVIRHPNYAGAVLMGLTSGLVFGSWLSILPMLFWIGLIAYRTLNEEKVLSAELEGYRDYAQKVRFRFLPGIW